MKKTEFFDAIQKFREYRDKAIEIKCDYDKLIEREMEILTMEKEREKRFKKQLSNIYKKIFLKKKPLINLEKSYKSEYEQLDEDLLVNYNARCNEYKNIKCTKYVFKIQDHLRMYWYFVKKT